MTDIRFYHLTKTNLDRALFQLLNKIHQTGKRTLVLARDEETVKDLDQALWTLGGEAFLPHGTKKDGRPEDQPIWLSTTSEPENQNNSEILVLCDQATLDEIDKFSICCEVFDGKDQQAVQHARDKWKQYKDADHELSYWQQTSQGGWEKKQ